MFVLLLMLYALSLVPKISVAGSCKQHLAKSDIFHMCPEILPSVLWHCWLGGRKGIRPVKTECWVAGVVVCLQQGADLVQLMPLPLTVSCFSKIQIGFTFLVLAHQGSPGKRAVKRVCVCVSWDFIQFGTFIVCHADQFFNEIFVC